MRRVLLCCAVLLACLMPLAFPAVASSSTTTVGGKIPLTVHQVVASSITCSGAVISWQTNGPSTSQVFYDTVWHDNVADYAHHIESDGLVLIHSLSLSGLSSGTSYSYAVESVLPDSADSLAAVQTNYVFTTLASVTIITISSPPNGQLPRAEVGVAYSQPLVALGGTPPYGRSIATGCLPSGLSLNACTGVISGTPTEAGMFAFTVQVKDKAGATATAALRIRIIVGPHLCPASHPNTVGEIAAALVASSASALALISATISGR